MIVVGFNSSAEAKDALRLSELLCEALGDELAVGCAYPYQSPLTRHFDGQYEQFLRQRGGDRRG